MPFRKAIHSMIGSLGAAATRAAGEMCEMISAPWPGDMPRRTVFFAAFNALLIALYMPELKAAFGAGLKSELYSHIMAVPAVSAYFLFGERKRIFSGPSYGYGAGLGLMITALCVHIFGANLGIARATNDFLSITAISAVLFWYGGFVFFYGAGSFAAARFPLYFLLFAIPLPEALMEWFIELLRAGSAGSAWAILSLSGMPVERDGFFFLLPGMSIEVASECSGIRSGIALVITSVIAGRLYLSSWAGRFALAAVSVPVAVFKNGVRIAVLTWLGFYVDEGVLQGPLHSRGGIPFFILALLMMAVIVYLFRRAERRLNNRSGAA